MNTEAIKEIVNDSLKESEYFLVDLEISKDKKNVFIYLDGDNGIDINTCAKFSRIINTLLETKEIIKDQYNLQVSSPGIDRPLKFKRQYKRNLGRNLKVVIKEGDIYEGELIFMDDDQIIIKTEKEDQLINFSNIEKSKVII